MALGFVAWAAKEAASAAIGITKSFLKNRAADRKERREQQAKKPTGSQMASAIVKRKESRPVVQTQPTTTLIGSSSSTKGVKKASSRKSSGVGSVDRVLDKIDNTLFNMINVVGDSSKLKSKVSSQQQRVKKRRFKKMRESLLESSSSIVGKIGSAVTSPVKGLGNLLSRFFGSVLVGSLVLFVVNKWQSIVGWFKKAWEKIKEFWELFMKPVKWTWNALKWIVSAGGGQDLIKKGEDQLAIMKGENKKIDNELTKMETKLNEKKDMNDLPPPEQVSFIDKFLGINPAEAGTLENKPVRGNDFWTLVAVAAREDNDGQGRADVAQSIYNRAESGIYGSDNIRDLILQGGQYQPTWTYPRAGEDGIPNREWYMINDAQSAAAATGLSVAEIKKAASEIRDKDLQKKASSFVGGRTDFMGGEEKARFDLGDVRRGKQGEDNFFGNFVGPASEEYGKTNPIAAPVPMDLSSSIRNQASYDMAGGTTIIMMGGGNNGSSGGQEGSSQILPIPLVNSVDYAFDFKASLVKAG